MNRVFSFILLSSISLLSFAQTPKSHTEVQSVITRLFDGLAALDITAVRVEVTSDFLLLEEGQVWNIDSLITAIEPLKELTYKRDNNLEFIRTEVKGKMAWVSYKNWAEVQFFDLKRDVKWLESAVLVKERKRWRIKLLHSTRLEN